MSIQVTALLNPFSSKKTDFTFEDGLSVQEIIAKIDTLHAVNTGWRVLFDDEIVTDFSRIPCENQHIYIKLVPEGDSTEDTGTGMKAAGAGLAVLGVIVSCCSFGLAAPLGAALIGAGISLFAGGMVLYNTDVSTSSTESSSQDPSIRGSQNQAREYGTIPTLLGKRRIYPDLAAESHTMVDPDTGDMYLLQLLCAGQKDMTIDTSTIKIDETLLADYSESGDIDTILSGGDSIIDMRIHQDGTLPEMFDSCVHEDQVYSQLVHEDDDGVDGSIVRTTPDKTEEINVDIFFPNGLGTSSGESATVQVCAYYKKASEDDSAYQLMGIFDPSAKVTGTTYTQVFKITSGTYKTLSESVIWNAFSKWAYDSGDVFTVDTGSKSSYTLKIKSYAYHRPTSGKRDTDHSGYYYNIYFSVSYKDPDTYGSNVITASDLSTLRYAITLTGLEADSYTVKFTRVTEDSDSSSVIDTVYVGSVRAIKHEAPVSAEIAARLTLIELKIKATSKLSGTISQLNFIAQSKLPVYAGSGSGSDCWSNALSSNPASAMLSLGGNAPIDTAYQFEVYAYNKTVQDYLDSETETDHEYDVDTYNKVSVDYARKSVTALATGVQDVLNSSINSTKIADGSITEVKVATDAITETKISDDAISTPKLQANAITAEKIAACAVTAEKIETNAVEARVIAANAVTAEKIYTYNMVTLTEGTHAISGFAAGADTDEEFWKYVCCVQCNKSDTTCIDEYIKSRACSYWLGLDSDAPEFYMGNVTCACKNLEEANYFHYYPTYTSNGAVCDFNLDIKLSNFIVTAVSSTIKSHFNVRDKNSGGYDYADSFMRINPECTASNCYGTAAESVCIKGDLYLVAGNNCATTGTAGSVTACGDACFGGTLGVNGNSCLCGTLGVSGNATLGGTVSVTGATTLTGALTANGGVNTNTLSVSSTSTFTGAVTANGGVNTTSVTATVGVVSSTTAMALTSGLPQTQTSATAKLYCDALALRGSGSDAGWVRFFETTTDSGCLEIATGDNGTEPILARQYNTSGAIVNSMTLLDANGYTCVNYLYSTSYVCAGTAVVAPTLCGTTAVCGGAFYSTSDAICIGTATYPTCAVSTTYSIGIGGSACASGAYATAVGESSRATGVCTVAIGAVACANSECSIAIGASACAGVTGANCAIAIGASAIACGINNITLGTRALTMKCYNIAIGYCTCACSYGGIAIGCNVQITSASCHSVAIGSCICSMVYCSLALGYKSCTACCGGSLVRIVEDVRLGGVLRRLTVHWFSGALQCNIFNAFHDRLRLNWLSCSTEYIGGYGKYGTSPLLSIKYDMNESPLNIDFRNEDQGITLTVFDGCTCVVSYGGYMTVVAEGCW